MKNSKNFGKNLGRETRYINIFFLILRKLRNSRRNYGQRLRGTTSFHSVSFHFFLNPAILSRRGTRDNYFNLSKNDVTENCKRGGEGNRFSLSLRRTPSSLFSTRKTKTRVQPSDVEYESSLPNFVTIL